MLERLGFKTVRGASASYGSSRDGGSPPQACAVKVFVHDLIRGAAGTMDPLPPKLTRDLATPCGVASLSRPNPLEFEKALGLP